MRETGPSAPLMELSLGSLCPQESKRERKVKANYVGVCNVGFFY